MVALYVPGGVVSGGVATTPSPVGVTPCVVETEIHCGPRTQDRGCERNSGACAGHRNVLRGGVRASRLVVKRETGGAYHKRAEVERIQDHRNQRSCTADGRSHVHIAVIDSWQ